jgi:predicted TIM-barrel fold metal-dependent hydrolase
MPALEHIDTHSHWVPDSYVAALESRARRSTAFAQANRLTINALANPDSPARRIEMRLEEMDGCGVGMSVLAIPPPGITFVTEREGGRVARTINDELLDAASRYPGRFAIAVNLPFPHVDACIAELDRVASHPYAQGVSLLTVTGRYTVDAPELQRVYARIAELGLPVLAHPAGEPCAAAYADFMLAATVEPMVSSTLGITRLVFSGMLDRVPSLEVIVPHLGGTLPYLAQRLVDFGSGAAEHDLVHYLRERMYLDTCSYHPPALRCAADTAGYDRLVLGSDYPFRGKLARAVQDVVDNAPDAGTAEQILGGTASRWFAAPVA